MVGLAGWVAGKEAKFCLAESLSFEFTRAFGSSGNLRCLAGCVVAMQCIFGQPGMKLNLTLDLLSTTNKTKLYSSFED